MMARMKNRVSIAALLLALAGTAHAEDGLELAAKSKAQVSSGGSARAAAPFIAGHDPLPELALREESDRRGARGTCTAAATDLCYDLAEGRLTYRGARPYMPQLGGLTAESVALRRNGIVLKYSFR